MRVFQLFFTVAFVGNTAFAQDDLEMDGYGDGVALDVVTLSTGDNEVGGDFGFTSTPSTTPTSTTTTTTTTTSTTSTSTTSTSTTSTTPSTITVTIDGVHGSNYIQSDARCGGNIFQKVVQGRIVNGVEAKPNTWPWLVVMLQYGDLRCGGTIISEQYILTAAHCCTHNGFRLDVNTISFVAGEHDLTDDSVFEQRVNAHKLFVHPKYDDNTKDYDFCVVKTDLIELDGVSRDIVCLPLQNEHIKPNDDISMALSDTNCHVAGWGALSAGTPDVRPVLPDVLQTTSVKIFSDEYCIKTSLYTLRDELFEDTLNTGASFCAGYDDGGQDSCQGDSGGPLICVVDEAPVLYGVVSWGEGCADSDYPGIYAKVASQIDWLSSIILDASNWNEWGSWETCSVSCAVSGKGGTQKRTRTCDNKGYNSFGEVVPCLPSQILNEDIQPCNTEICPIDKTVPDCSCPTNFKCKDKCDKWEKCEPFETTKNPSGKFNGLCVSNSFGKCRVTNDPWIETFDGENYFAPYWTKYLLTEYGSVSNDPVPHYKVTIRSGQWNDYDQDSPLSMYSRMTGLTFSFTKPGNPELIEMDFKFDQEEIASATITIGGGNPISDVLDPVWSAGTYFSAEIVTLTSGGVDSVFICTWSNICLDLSVRYYDATVQLPPTYSNLEPTIEPKGLCGNFNQDKEDDRKLRPQDWEVPGSRRTRRNDEESEELTNDSLDMTCPESAKYDPICENLFVSTFWDECRAVLSTEYVITICKFEYCLVPTSDVLMTIFNTYARDCRSHLPRDTEAFCTYESAEWYQSMNIIPPQTAGYKKCGENMTFTGCGFQSKDMRTCEQHMLNTPPSKTELSKSGCVCKAGFVHHHNECISTSSCPSPVGDGLGFDTTGDGVGNGLPEVEDKCTQDEFMTETALAVNGLKNLVEGFGNPILVRSLRKKWTKVINFSFAKRNGERHGCAVAMNTPVPMSCAISGSADVELEQAMTNFCQLFEQFVEWGIGQCEQKHARRMQKVMSMCTIAKRMIARTIAKRNKQ